MSLGLTLDTYTHGKGVGRKQMDTHMFIGKPGLVQILQVSPYRCGSLSVCGADHGSVFSFSRLPGILS